MKPSEISHISIGLFECTSPKSGEAIDPWTIDDVLVLSADSKNRRKYTDQCLQEAVSEGIYEGVPFGVNHSLTRDVRDLPGHFDNTRFVKGTNGNPSAIRARMTLTTHDAFTESLHRVAATNPKKYGLSHHIPKGGYKAHVANDGTLIVEKIYRVKSVDLVDEPGSGKGLFEETEPVTKVTFKEYAKTLPSLPSEVKRFDAILESMGPLADIEITPCDAAAKPEDKIKSSFKQLLGSITESYEDDDANLQEGIKTVTTARHAMLTGEEIKKPTPTPAIKEGVEPVLLGWKGASELLTSKKIDITPALLESFSVQTKEIAEPLLESLVAANKKNADLEARLKLIPDDQKTRSSARTSTEAITESVETDKDGKPVEKPFKARWLEASVN